MSFRCIKAFMHAFSGRFSRTCLEGISFNFFVCFIFNVSLGSAPKRKNFDIQRNTRVASGGQFTLNYHTPSHNQPLYAHFVELPLWSGESLAGSGCFCWKSNWTKFDHVGSTGGNWETISGSFSISFRSKLEVQSQCVPFIVLTPWYNWWIR